MFAIGSLIRQGSHWRVLTWPVDFAILIAAFKTEILFRVTEKMASRSPSRMARCGCVRRTARWSSVH